MLYRSSRLLAIAALLVAPTAAAGPPAKQPAQHGRTAKLEPPARRGAPGRSVGSPTAGQLLGGAHLEEGPHLKIVPVYAPGDVRWGLESLVKLVDQAGRSVRKQFPDAVLSVGHLSRKGGGAIDRHASHESGRDADIGFYVRDHRGKSIYADHFVSFRGDGTAPTWPGARFDDAMNWALVAALVKNVDVRITHIFVATPLRARLLRYAEKSRAPASVRRRAAALLTQPRGSQPHDDHFHVRIACPPNMDKCIERPLARKPRPSTKKTAAASNAQRAKPRAPSASRAPAAPAPTPAPAPAPKPEPRDDEPEASKRGSLIPSLAPMVPGLDSVVIPAPLAITRSPGPKGELADDPDRR